MFNCLVTVEFIVNYFKSRIITSLELTVSETKPCWERASHSALRVFARKNVLLCLMYFLSHLVSMLGF